MGAGCRARGTLRAGLPRSPSHALALVVALVAHRLWTVLTVWGVRHALAVNRLASGVGDVIFYGGMAAPGSGSTSGVATCRCRRSRRRSSRRCWPPKIGASTGIRGSIRSAWRARCSSTRAAARCARARPRSPSSSRGRCFSRTDARWAARSQEAALAVMLEVRLSKAQILELYLNRVYLSAGLYGVEAMSTGAFGKHARDLTLAESALIAGLVQAPSALSPWSNLDGARRRSDTVLARMVAAGDITPAQARGGARRPSDRSARTRRRWCRGTATRRSSSGSSSATGSAATSLRTGRCTPRCCPDCRTPPSSRWPTDSRGSASRGLQAALVALDPATGQRAGRRRRAGLPAVTVQSGHPQPPAAGFGVQAVCVCRGARAGAVAGQRVDGPGEHGAAWQGGMDAAQRLVARRGPRDASPGLLRIQQPGRGGAAAASRCACDSRAGRAMRALANQPDVPSLALGSGLVSPLALTAAYAAFSNGGDAVRPAGDPARARSGRRRRAGRAGAARARAVGGGRLPDDQPDGGRDRAGHRHVGAAVGPAGPVAGKTGSTNEFKDAWFVATRRDVVVGVWVGFDQPATIARDAFGGRIAAPIWADFMRRSSRVVGRRARFKRRPRSRPTSCAASRSSGRWMAVRSTRSTSSRQTPKPRQHCQMHEGTLRQRAQRAVEKAVVGALRSVWNKNLALTSPSGTGSTSHCALRCQVARGWESKSVESQQADAGAVGRPVRRCHQRRALAGAARARCSCRWRGCATSWPARQQPAHRAMLERAVAALEARDQRAFS